MNKKEREKLKREAHKRRMREAKERRRSGGKIERPNPSKVERPKILIVCEGENTEPSYFSQFKLSSADIYPVGEGKNTLSLVDSVQKIIERSKYNYDEIWCVFDKDDFPNQNFDNAIKKADSLGYKVAYSNQAFEFWFILHFESHNGGAMHRDDYCKKINQHLDKYKSKYDCESKIVESEFFEIMLSLTGRIITVNEGEEDEKEKKESLQDLAIARAKKINEYHTDTTPANSESSTQVYKLVQNLNQYI